MRDRFDEQLMLLNKKMTEMGALCEEVIALSAKALEECDPALAERVAPRDSEIDSMERDIETLCLRLLLQQQPVARDLRQISPTSCRICPRRRTGAAARSVRWRAP